ncbi:polyphosphate polymerase domain-containing protein [Arcicella aquatica]|uniref:Polyphosphate polymerase domain-containing protein n=1 Tax=Arcicella aquatica TaxID=217141 RepID=A0ABU5QUT0_9BACT|nr:polyphosphate polymerase domain-containing protein [Arcicella aquatica]MEA5260469.1 polyphosphate polymerase domain-containing protein [Arcicella aquatica]
MGINSLLDTITKEIAGFESITLAEMDKVKLMDRVDVKYVIPLWLLPELLKEAREHYKVVVVNHERICAYETQYFDEDNQMALYHQHQTGSLNRYKVRTRNYVGSDLQFFEIKFKNNKGRTLKKRIRTTEYDKPMIDEDNERDFLEKHSPFHPNDLKGVLWVFYRRITLVSKHHLERLTIDLELCFKNDDKEKAYPTIVIAEVKQQKKGASHFIELMKKYHIREGSISKYCFGIISLIEGVKYNRFKPHLLKITKLIRQHDALAGHS